MEASKNEIKSIQGLCIIAMVLLHLFDRYEYSYTPTLFIGTLPLCFFFGQMGDFCVMGYAFCSGYSHSIRSELDGKDYFRRRLKSLLKLIVNYWLIVIIFSVVGFITGHGNIIPKSPLDFFKNLFFISNSYNGAWWYITTYIFIVISSPIIIKAIKKHSFLMTLFMGLLYFVSYIVRFRYETSNWFIVQAYLYGMTIAEYSIGVLFDKYKILGAIKNVWNKKKSNWLTVLVCVIFVIFSYFRCIYAPTLFIAPICGVFIIVLYHLFYCDNLFFRFIEWVGTHSTNIWLTHFFFIGSLFTGVAFIVKYPLLIWGFVMGITILISVVINAILKKILAICKL